MAALVCLCALGEFDSATTNHTSPLSLASSRLAVHFDFSPPITDSSVSPSSLPIQSSTASQSHKRLKLTPPTDTPTANHVTAGVSACSGAVLEIVRQDAIQTVDTDVHDVSWIFICNSTHQHPITINALSCLFINLRSFAHPTDGAGGIMFSSCPSVRACIPCWSYSVPDCCKVLVSPLFVTSQIISNRFCFLTFSAHTICNWVEHAHFCMILKYETTLYT